MGRDGDDPVDQMLSWRFGAGAFGLVAVIYVALQLDQRGLRDPFIIVTLAVPVGMFAYLMWRYLRARRDLQARGLWPEGRDSERS